MRYKARQSRSLLMGIQRLLEVGTTTTELAPRGRGFETTAFGYNRDKSWSVLALWASRPKERASRFQLMATQRSSGELVMAGVSVRPGYGGDTAECGLSRVPNS